jgi:anaerobic magnesium-protoporphyrin IX monomethyl ester cyclase
MTSVLLIYPYFKPNRDRSRFRFPPLGVCYIAASLRQAGHEVKLLDCTFLTRGNALEAAIDAKAKIVGIYCMVSMLEDCLWMAKQLRDHCSILVAGGPLPTCEPLSFIESFDVVVRGEAEETVCELIRAIESGADLSSVSGIVYQTRTAASVEEIDGYSFSPDRPFIRELDNIPFPARDLLPNQDYILYAKGKYGYSITTVLSTRGCPYQCEFCSNVVFGGSYRERSAHNVVDEIEVALGMGYERISFADDVFTLNRDRVLKICEEINRRKLSFAWECLGRVDRSDDRVFQAMRNAGCTRIYFGVESGNDSILKLMNKKITKQQAQNAVEAAHRAGLQVGAFFILCYPGETNDTVLETLHFATNLPLDYLGLSMPYPLPGTALYERVKDRIAREWRPEESLFGSHVLIYNAEFSESKIWFGILKGHAQFVIKNRLGRLASPLVWFFEKLTNWIFRLLR